MFGKIEPVQTRSLKKKRTEHIGPEELAAFTVGRLSARRKEATIEHLASCPTCRRRVAEVTISRRFVRDPNESCN